MAVGLIRATTVREWASGVAQASQPVRYFFERSVPSVARVSRPRNACREACATNGTNISERLRVVRGPEARTPWQ